MAGSQPFGSLINTARGFGQLPMVRQLGLLIGLSASIALGFAVVMWSKEPNYRPVFSHLNTEQTTSILDALQSSGVKYKLDQKSGTVLVPSDDVYRTRLKLASNGLPETTGSGFDTLLKEQGIGTSRFMENARYVYALEGELNRTISSLNSVKSARVHLAIPKQSAFIGTDKQPTASVLVDLASGHQLTQNQVQAVVHMVASSVPDLKPSSVTVVDGKGRLLTGSNKNDTLGKSKEEFQYTSNLENAYAKRIESIITPLVGEGNVRAKVTALIDFSKVEQTSEKYIPNKDALRSEQVLEQVTGQNEKAAKGVPGALSNQPPAADPNAKNKQQAEQQQGPSGPYRKQATRNYELGKTISHLQNPAGKIARLSVAVVVNDKRTVDAKTGKATETPISQEEIQKITALVKNTIGFDQKRGDQVSIVNIPFVKAQQAEVPPAPPIWEQNWFWDSIKIGASGLLILLLVLLVLRPVLKNLAAKGVDAPPLSAGVANLAAPGAQPMPGTQQAGGVAPQQVAGQPQIGQQPQLEGWNAVQQLAQDDPKKVAQVMKSWVGND